MWLWWWTRLFLLLLNRFWTLLWLESVGPWYVIWGLFTVTLSRWSLTIFSITLVSFSNLNSKVEIRGTVLTSSFLFPSMFSWINSVDKLDWRNNWTIRLWKKFLLDKIFCKNLANSSSFNCWLLIQRTCRGGSSLIFIWGKRFCNVRWRKYQLLKLLKKKKKCLYRMWRRIQNDESYYDAL